MNKLDRVAKNILAEKGVSVDEILSTELKTIVSPGERNPAPYLEITFRSKSYMEKINQDAWDKYNNSSKLVKWLLGEPNFLNSSLTNSQSFVFEIPSVELVKYILEKI